MGIRAGDIAQQMLKLFDFCVVLLSALRALENAYGLRLVDPPGNRMS